MPLEMTEINSSPPSWSFYGIPGEQGNRLNLQQASVDHSKGNIRHGYCKHILSSIH